MFFRALWDLAPKKYAADGIGLGAYLNFMNSSFVSDCEWRRAYSTTFKGPWKSEELMSPDRVLQMALTVATRYDEKYKFDLSSVKHVLQAIQEGHYQYEKEKRLLMNCLEQALEGKEWDWIEEYYFFDWCDK
jgi:hypothetical protein